MTRNYLTIIITLLSLTSVNGQQIKASCDCPKTNYTGTKADSTFHLSNGKTIILCGSKTTNINSTTFSEFILTVCGEDTIIDFWDAELNCKLKLNGDTLLIEQVQNLPTGIEFEFKETTWTIEKMYFNKQKLVRNLMVNDHIRKYSQEEIQFVLNDYETAKSGLDNSKIEIANKLFIATISGDKKGRQYLKEFKTKFGPLDGEYAEEYSKLLAMLELWDKLK